MDNECPDDYTEKNLPSLYTYIYIYVCVCVFVCGNLY